ncbi:alcohol dehydrogenase catalytic domain-containing protein [Humitalea rosea]|uniref:alcohol dehydrogenase catalytic domain-containing protein n=1 Tax=Humitalea rosea TaxID=990373 RepID=UPI000DAEED3D|nr:alcohol dehydrogenase catalytic domain-containing protein [Humitalea rosea]
MTAAAVILLDAGQSSGANARGGRRRYIAISGSAGWTDLRLVDGDLPDPKLPIIPGHEIIGIVDALGDGVTDAAFVSPLAGFDHPVAAAPLMRAGLIGWRALRLAGTSGSDRPPGPNCCRPLIHIKPAPRRAAILQGDMAGRWARQHQQEARHVAYGIARPGDGRTRIAQANHPAPRPRPGLSGGQRAARL